MKNIPHGFPDMPLAVIGMACRLPGADNLDDYWRLLCRSETAITELPPERLDQDLYYHPDRGIVGKTYSKLGGVVADRPFDRESCPISEELIAASDSVPLAMLEVAAAACSRAWGPSSARKSSTASRRRSAAINRAGPARAIPTLRRTRSQG
jgi:acyl transferase domain-containing protein